MRKLLECLEQLNFNGSKKSAKYKLWVVGITVPLKYRNTVVFQDLDTKKWWWTLA